MSTSTANPHPTRNGRGSDADKYRIVQHRNNIADTIKRNLQLWGCSVFIYVRMFIGSCDVTTKQLSVAKCTKFELGCFCTKIISSSVASSVDLWKQSYRRRCQFLL
jgi:hypothetical protein